MHETKSQPEYLLRELGNRGLDPVSKERMRVHLSAYADFHTVRAGARRSAGSLWGIFSGRGLVPMVALLMFALLAGGTTYASEKALPGDALYTVKIKVAEPVVVALATTPEKKAEVHADLAERRLEEATKLAVQQTLTPETAVFLEQEFSEHVDAHLAAADTLAAEGKMDASLDTRSDLEARLVAHADILDLVEDHLQEAGAPVHGATESVLATVKLRQEVVSETRVALEREVADDATPTKTLALVTKASEAVLPAAKSAALAPVAEHAAEADTALLEAKEALDDSPENTGRAFKKARESERASATVTTLLENSDILMAVGAGATTTASSTTATTTASTTLPVED